MDDYFKKFMSNLSFSGGWRYTNTYIDYFAQILHQMRQNDEEKWWQYLYEKAYINEVYYSYENFCQHCKDKPDVDLMITIRCFTEDKIGICVTPYRNGQQFDEGYFAFLSNDETEMVKDRLREKGREVSDDFELRNMALYKELLEQNGLPTYKEFSEKLRSESANLYDLMSLPNEPSPEEMEEILQQEREGADFERKYWYKEKVSAER